jgi:hypothetical protein
MDYIKSPKAEILRHLPPRQGFKSLANSRSPFKWTECADITKVHMTPFLVGFQPNGTDLRGRFRGVSQP